MKELMCPKCGKVVQDSRLLGFHMEIAHNVPFSVALNILNRMEVKVHLSKDT